jgi:hypothetical protein
LGKLTSRKTASSRGAAAGEPTSLEVKELEEHLLRTHFSQLFRELVVAIGFLLLFAVLFLLRRQALDITGGRAFVSGRQRRPASVRGYLFLLLDQHVIRLQPLGLLPRLLVLAGQGFGATDLLKHLGELLGIAGGHALHIALEEGKKQKQTSWLGRRGGLCGRATARAT